MVWGRISLEAHRPPLLASSTLTAVRFQDEIFRATVRPYTGALGPGFLLVHDNSWPYTARVCRQFLDDEGIDDIDWPSCSPNLNSIHTISSGITSALFHPQYHDCGKTLEQGTEPQIASRVLQQYGCPLLCVCVHGVCSLLCVHLDRLNVKHNF